MYALFRTAVYATLFVVVFLIFVPAWVLSHITYPDSVEAPQVAGLILGALGFLLVLWSVITFAFVGKGTPAIFDPPRRLVVKGAYRFVRNPMYIGGGVALIGAALYHESLALLGYAVVFSLITDLFVIAYEEPTLLRTFEHEYDRYCQKVGRWWPDGKVRRHRSKVKSLV